MDESLFEGNMSGMEAAVRKFKKKKTCTRRR